ncbi:MAG: phosphoenolpyruvate--protein phosphotransferase, partial [Chloroflexi bacterium]
MAGSIAGIGVSPGTAVGPAHLVRSVIPAPGEQLTPSEELEAFDAAIRRGSAELERLAARLRVDGQESEARIIDAQLLMLGDPTLVEGVRRRIGKHEAAATAIQAETDGFKAMLAAMDDEYLAARAGDVQDVATRLIRDLHPQEELPSPQEPYVLVAHDLTPSETASLDRSLVLGFAIDAGSPTSHTAIMAEALNIPAVVGLRDITSRVTEGRRLALDGADGLVVIDPNPTQILDYERRRRDAKDRSSRLRSLRELPTVTVDGHRFVLAANIGSPSDVPAALDAGAEGVGLLRTEFLFHGREQAPDEEEQTRAYRAVIEAMPGHRVVVRTLDAGGDKPLPYLRQRAEKNPVLGLRGVRFTLASPEIFRTQLRALMRASVYGELCVMFPMVGESKQVEEARATLEAVRTEVGGGAQVGIMIEVPAAALIADQLARHVDFFSVGTNDLVQYALAVDRGNEQVADLYRPLHPGVVRLLDMTVQASHAHGRWAGVCGEMAADNLAIPILIG